MLVLVLVLVYILQFTFLRASMNVEANTNTKNFKLKLTHFCSCFAFHYVCFAYLSVVMFPCMLNSPISHDFLLERLTVCPKSVNAVEAGEIPPIRRSYPGLETGSFLGVGVYGTTKTVKT